MINFHTNCFQFEFVILSLCLIRHCWLAGLSLKCKVENGKVQPAICSKQKQVVCILLKSNSTQCVAVLASSQRSFLLSWANLNRSSPTIPLLPSYRRQHRLSRNLPESLHQQSDLVTLASIIIAWYQSFLLVCGKWSATVIFAVHPDSRSIQFNHKFWRNTNALFWIQLLSMIIIFKFHLRCPVIFRFICGLFAAPIACVLVVSVFRFSFESLSVHTCSKSNAVIVPQYHDCYAIELLIFILLHFLQTLIVSRSVILATDC